MDFAEIKNILESHDHYTILTHKSPDGDTLGSGFALCDVLRGMGKKANVVNSEAFPPRYGFLFENYAPMNFEEQYVIAVDIADTQLLGSGLSAYAEPGRIDLCIDHHVSNKQFATQTYVDANASAVALILYDLFRFMEIALTKTAAVCLYTGIATDTGCFKYENTTPAAHLAAAGLMAHGIDFSGINRKMFDVKSKGRVLLEQSAVANMEFFFDDRCSMLIITRQMMDESGMEPAEFDGLASIPLQIEGVEIGITVRQRHERIFKVSARTTERFDASEFCRSFGGGGHKRAAGCEISGTLEEVKDQLTAQLRVLFGYTK